MLPELPNTYEKVMSFPLQEIESIEESCHGSIENDHLYVDQIIPGMYHCDGDEHCTPDNIRSHGFTHIIHIDKHISYLHIPVIPTTTTATVTTKSSINSNINCNNIRNDQKTETATGTTVPTTTTSNNHNKNHNHIESISKIVDLSKEFEILDLNFGDESYLITVLPNCYKAVKFLDKALENNGAIIIIDHNHNNNKQKCLTIVTAYLMYKNHLSVPEAFLRLQTNFNKAELDGFFISQLYEYEPILQVQRSEDRGSSCSREMRSALLKRKKYHDNNYISIDYNFNLNYYDDSTDILME